MSNDYQPGEDNWMIGLSSMFADAIGIAPFQGQFLDHGRAAGKPIQ